MLRKIFYLSPLVILLFVFSLSVNVSCKKDTVTEHAVDTTLTSTILTANPWKIREDRAMVSSSSNYIYYQRGGSSNTINLDNEFMTFNANGTGTYTDNGGGQTTFTWSFSDPSNTKLVWIWAHPSGSVTVTWENIIYQGAAIRYTEYYTLSGAKTLSSITRIPR